MIAGKSCHRLAQLDTQTSLPDRFLSTLLPSSLIRLPLSHWLHVRVATLSCQYLKPRLSYPDQRYRHANIEGRSSNKVLRSCILYRLVPAQLPSLHFNTAISVNLPFERLDCTCVQGLATQFSTEFVFSRNLGTFSHSQDLPVTPHKPLGWQICCITSSLTDDNLTLGSTSKPLISVVPLSSPAH